jgi:nitrogen fixation protein NifU and related proteins
VKIRRNSHEVYPKPFGRADSPSRAAIIDRAKSEARRITITAVYSSELLDHFQNPRNVGDVETPDVFAQLENPACGDVLKLTAKLAGKRITDIRFCAKGCVPAIACGSALTELIKGKTVEEARQMSREELVRKVGGLPQASAHASNLAMDTLAKLLLGL